MARKKSSKVKEWVVEALIANINKGLTTIEQVRTNNPDAARAIEKYRDKLAAEQARKVPYSLGFWDKNGVGRVYINGGRLADQCRFCKVWFEAGDESTEGELAIRERGDWYEAGPSFAVGGAKPWEVIAEEALVELGASLADVTFDDLIHMASK